MNFINLYNNLFTYYLLIEKKKEKKRRRRRTKSPIYTI